MSARGRDWAEAQRIRSLTLKAVLFKLGHLADPRGLVFHSQATIADRCGCDVKTIRHALQKLEDLGLIRREARLRRDGSRSSDHIHLAMPAEEPAASAPTPAASAPRVGAEDPQGGGGAPPLTTFESFSESHLESGSDPSGSAPPGGAGRIDFRKDLFGRGVGIVRNLTGRAEGSARSLVGSWIGLAGGDCAAALSAIDAAVDERVCEPVSWIEARLRRRRAELASVGLQPGRGAAPGASARSTGLAGTVPSPADLQSRNDAAMAQARRGVWPVGGNVFVAADSPEGEAWEGHFRPFGVRPRWTGLARGLGWHMPSAMPPAPAELAS